MNNNIYLPTIEKPINKKIYIVCGAPASGKSTYVKGKAKDSDLILDLDEIISGFSGMPIYSESEKYIKVAIQKRNYILNNLNNMNYKTIYLIVSAPTRAERSHWKEQLDGTVIMIATNENECYKRLDNDTRRSNNILKYRIAIKKWFNEYTEGCIDKKIIPPQKKIFFYPKGP